MNKPCWALHPHHADYAFGILINGIKDRVLRIEQFKPKHERATRVRLMVEIDPAKLPTQVRVAGESWAAALLAARNINGIGPRPDMTGLANPCLEFGAYPIEHLWHVYLETMRVHHDELEALHAKLCVLDCPWDGATIFPER